MAIIEYEIAPGLQDELGPGILRRQRKPGLFEWVGKGPEPNNQKQRFRFAGMAWAASLDWWTKLNGANRLSWYYNADRVHHRRPGNAGMNMYVQPYARWMTTAGPLTYHQLPNLTLGATPLTATFSAFTITAYDHAAKTVDVTTTIDSPYSQPPPIALDTYQLRPLHGLPWLSWHCFTWLHRLTSLNAGNHVYTFIVHLRYFQPPGSRIILWGRLRNGQDANDYQLATWDT